MKSKLLLVLFLVAFQFTNAQDRQLFFQGETIDMPLNIDSFKTADTPQNTVYNNGFFGWIQFSETPTQLIQDSFKSKNYKLLNYIAKKTYLVYLPTNVDMAFLKESGVVSVLPMKNILKMTSNVKHRVIGDWAIDSDKVLLNIQHYKLVKNTFVTSEIVKIEELEIREQYKNNNNIVIAIPENKISELINLPFIKWAELISEPSVKEDFRGRSIHRSSGLDTQTAGGRNYTGEGIGVLVRDDGIVGPHIDFQGRIDNSNASGTGQTHGDGVAGIMTGSGNLDPTKRGMAAGSDVFIVNYNSSFLDFQTTDLLNNGSVQITNSSYGNGCNAGYTSTTQTVDSQTNTNQSLLHVFSAGNSGTSNCNYGAGSGWGNITGGHKQGKNVIATANVFFDGSTVSSSSHGPAYDGRIKPDITAHGQGQLSTNENNAYLSFGGTSGAAPGIAGVSAQLYQLFKDNNSGNLPESALIKAALLNTAQDYGRTGPDFEYGWGVVNGLRAGMLLEDQRYLDAQVSQGANNNHTINVPSGTTQVRFMLYWNDPAATSGAAKALINDLDLKVTDPSSAQLLPWILDPTPNAGALTTPATTGVDRLNNMEQVLINSPQAGNYTINVDGFDIPQGPQKYYIVYEIVSDELVLTYPQGGEKMVVGENQTIHWDATNVNSNINIEYSNDNGGSWTNISNVSSTQKNYTWSIPSSLEPGEYLVRITSGSFTSTSSTFNIAGMVTGIDVSQICPTSFTVNWTPLANATGYDVYRLGTKYMEVIGSTTTQSYTGTITDPNEDMWIAVVAKGANWETRRSIAVFKAGGLHNCSLAKDIAIVSVEDSYANIACNGGSNLPVSAQVLNSGSDPQSNFTMSYQLDSGTIINETYSGTLTPGTQITYNFTTPLQVTTDGNHDLRVFVTLTDDENASNDEETITFYAQIDGADLNTAEDFETVFPPNGWKLDNPDNDTYTWQSATVTGSDGNSTKAAFMDHADYSTRGREDLLETQIYDLTGASNLELKFDLAKAQWSTSYNDKLRVEISTDCGATYTTVYEKEGLALSTIANYTASEWSPSTAADWRNETIDLNAYVDEKISIRFVSVNDYSNSTYIDNIELSGVLSTEKQTLDKELVIYPNPVEDKLNIRLSNSQQINTIKLYTLLGKQIDISNNLAKNNANYLLDTNNLTTGIYIVKVETATAVGYRKIIKK